jgi:hypothetical protein
MVDKWVEGSVLMHVAAQHNGADYHHFLQPNQYAEGSKTLSATELELAYRPQAQRAIDVARGYPLLRDAGRVLAERGVSFHDAVMVFAATEETLYRDICCHFNERGQQLLSEFMADRILGD